MLNSENKDVPIVIDSKLDWLSFTFKSQDEFCPVEFYRFLDRFPEMAKDIEEGSSMIVTSRKGASFYDSVYSVSDFYRISYNLNALSGVQAQTNMGVNISIPAHGLEHVFKLFGFGVDDVPAFLSLITSRGCKVSRIDIAYDDFSKIFRPGNFGRWFQNNQICSHFRSIKYITSAGISKGDTIYFGNRGNGKLLRIYDKEYESKGLIDAIRYEFEFHGKYCSSVTSYILQNQSFPRLDQILTDFIGKIVVPDGEKTRSHRANLPEWDMFLNEILLSRIDHTDTCHITKFIQAKDSVVSKLWYYARNVKNISMIENLCASDPSMKDSLERWKAKHNIEMRHSLEYMEFKSIFDSDPAKYRGAFNV